MCFCQKVYVSEGGTSPTGQHSPNRKSWICHCKLPEMCMESWSAKEIVLLVFRRKILCDAKPKPVSRKIRSKRSSYQFFSSFWHQEQNPAKMFLVLCGLSRGEGVNYQIFSSFWHQQQNLAKKFCSLWTFLEGGEVNYQILDFVPDARTSKKISSLPPLPETVHKLQNNFLLHFVANAKMMKMYCTAQGLKQTFRFGTKNLTFLWSGCGCQVFPPV